MGHSGKRQDRLVKLAREVGVTDEYPGYDLTHEETPSAAPEDVTQSVQEALTRTRTDQFESKKHKLRRNPSKAAPSAQEATATLEGLVFNRQCSAGHAQALIGLGADVNFSRHKSKSLVKRIRHKEQQDVRSTLLQIAIEHANTALTKVLAKKADQESLDAGLGVAITNKDLEAVKIVMSAGANPNQYESEFSDAVRDGKVDMVCALSSGKTPPSTTAVTHALSHAVNSGQLKMLLMLLWHGADSDYDEASAFLHAVQERKRDLVVAFCLAKQPPSPATLAKAIRSVFTGNNIIGTEHLKLVETLLAAGAKGEEVSAAVERATRLRNHDLVQLLVGYIDTDEGHSPNAIKSALAKGDLRLFENLIEMKYDSPTLDSLLSYSLATRHAVDHETRFSMIKVLVGQGISNSAKSDALVDAATNGEFDLAEYFVEQGASVDYENGKALKIAVEHQSMDLLTILLARKPRPESLALGFVAVCSVTEAKTRFEVMGALLKGGARGDAIHQALVDVIDSSPNSERFATLLLQTGEADVNFNIGEPVCQAIRCQNIAILRRLVEKSPSSESLNRALGACLVLQDQRTRLDISRILLQAGVTQRAVNEALVSAACMDQCDLLLVELLLSFNASVDFDLGSAIRTSIMLRNVELFRILLTSSAKPDTLSRALVDILSVADKNMKLDFASNLLGARASLITDELGKMLPNTFDTSNDLRTLDLFLQNGASVNHEGAQALKTAIKHENRAALARMLQFAPSPKSIRSAFACAWNLPDPVRLELLEIIMGSRRAVDAVDTSGYLVKAMRESHPSQDLISFLLRNNALIEHSDGQALHDCVSNLDCGVLELLLPHAKDRQVVSNAFGTAMRSDATWNSSSGSKCLRMLLDFGAYGPAADEAMMKAVEQYKTCETAAEILDKLIEKDASPNYDNGITLEIAAKTADPTLLGKLFWCAPNAATVTRAFPYIFSSGSSEETVLQLIDLFWGLFGEEIDLNAAHLELDPILFLCLKHYPHSTLILENLLQRGADPDQTMMYRADENVDGERVNVLLWAILQPRSAVPDTIIEVLIKAGANVNFESSSTATPLLAAVNNGSSGVVGTLLREHADVSVRGSGNRSALVYATMRGDLDIMRQLIAAGAPSDDGSIHIAARKGNSKAVQMLLDGEHSANYPSRIHDWRGPLEELVVKGKVRLNQAPEFKATIKALIDGGADPTYTHENGKSLLFLALDSPNAPDMTNILLSAFVENPVNEDFNKYKHNGYIFSALSYVEQNLQLSDPRLKPALIKILTTYRCNNIWYRESGDQPDGFVGAPLEIVQEHERRRNHLKFLAEKKEDADIENQVQRDKAVVALEVRKQAYEQDMWQDSQRAAQKLLLERNQTLDRRRLEEHDRAAALQHQRDLHNTELDYQKAYGLQEQALLDAKLIAQLTVERNNQEAAKMIQQEQERVSKGEHSRNMKEIEAKREGMKEQSRLLDKQKELARMTSSAQRYLSYGDELD